MTSRRADFLFIPLALSFTFACSDQSDDADPDGANDSTGGALGTGGATLGSGGAGSGGASSGGAGVGGSLDGTGGLAATGGSSSGGSAASGGASTGGSATGGGANTGSCPESAVLCEDFESGNLDQWKVNPAGGTLTLDAEHAAHGASGLRVDLPAGKAGGFLEFTGAPLFPLPNKKMFGRVMVYFESVPDGHTDIVRGATASGQVPWYNVGQQHGEVLLNYYVQYPQEDCWARPSPSYDIPTGTWMCWEWAFDGNLSQMEFYIDGELERRVSQNGDGCLQGNHVWEAPDFGSLQVGAYNAEPSNAPNFGRMWIDDVAVGTQELIGCPSL